MLLGMLVASVDLLGRAASVLGVNPFASLATASLVPPFADMVETTLFKFDFADLFCRSAGSPPSP